MTCSYNRPTRIARSGWQQLSGFEKQVVDSLFSSQDAATDYGDLANELLTTVLDGCGSRWTLKTAHTSDDEVRRTALDPAGSAKPPEKRKVGGSTPPLTTTFSRR